MGTRLSQESKVMPVKLPAMSSMQCRTPLALLCRHDIQLLQPEAPLLSADPLTVPDLVLNDLIPREWIEGVENDSEQPSISALTVQQ